MGVRSLKDWQENNGKVYFRYCQRCLKTSMTYKYKSVICYHCRIPAGNKSKSWKLHTTNKEIIDTWNRLIKNET